VSELLLASQPSYLSPYSSSTSQNVSTPDADAAAAASDSERGEQDQTRDDFFFSNEVAGAINALTRSNGYMYRQTWAQLCRFLLTSLPRHVFERYFIQGILLLTSDPVFNVRLAVAQIFIGFDWLKTPSISASASTDECKLLSEDTCPWAWLFHREDIRNCVRRLSEDDHDIVLAISKLEPFFPNLELRQISCIGMRVAPGGAIPVRCDDSSASKEEEVEDDDCGSDDVAFNNDRDDKGAEGNAAEGEGSDGEDVDAQEDKGRISTSSSLSSNEEVEIEEGGEGDHSYNENDASDPVEVEVDDLELIMEDECKGLKSPFSGDPDKGVKSDISPGLHVTDSTEEVESSNREAELIGGESSNTSRTETDDV
jgi:hypothetical protein